MKRLDFDVAVIGGGPTGTVAAIASARCGMNTILIEQHGYLGGALTACGTGPQMTFHAGERQVVTGIPQEMTEEMIRRGFSTGHVKDGVGFCDTTTAFDPEGMKVVWEDMVMESGAQILYHAVFTGCKVENGVIKSAQIYTKGGFYDLRAKVFIDASADADVANAAGIGSVFGRESDNLAQPMTMNFHVYNVDREKVCQYMAENPDDLFHCVPKDVRNRQRFDISGVYSRMKAAKEAGEFTYDREAVLCFETSTDGEYIVNMTRITKHSAVDAFELTEAEILGRKQVQETLHFLRKYVPGFENCRLAFSGPNIGIRESRKINGVYKLTVDDLTGNVMFPDAVAMGGYPIDVHSPDGEGTLHKFLKPGSWYSIPYRCLITHEVENIIVAGRCISATQEACSSTRLTPIVMALGQAAGTAAAQSIATGVPANQIDTDVLRDTLKKNGVFLEEYRPE
ncbi:MAG: FAD-dependent oxidoreductase [Clostridiales bacterium]|nr:FAD-dependent oxidoreductase [Clostridiales bacterium]